MMPLLKCNTLANTPARSSPKMKLRRVRRIELINKDEDEVVTTKR
jgi:hypothetical protein